MTLRIRSLEEYKKAYRDSVEDPASFWNKEAQGYQWMSGWNEVLKVDLVGGHNQWFIGGKLNITVNCLDRHLDSIGDQTAILWEPNDPEQTNRKLTYRELHSAVCQFANGLKQHGISKGDRVCFYMPMVPELVIGILACARIGAIHSVVFAGFSAVSLADRIKDASCKMVILSFGSSSVFDSVICTTTCIFSAS